MISYCFVFKLEFSKKNQKLVNQEEGGRVSLVRVGEYLQCNDRVGEYLQYNDKL